MPGKMDIIHTIRGRKPLHRRTESNVLDLQTFINQPINIGGKVVENRLFLAPMAALGHIAYRETVADYGGCGLQFMEMCNAKAVPHENRYVSTTFRWRDEELDTLVCQLFGSEPSVMAKAAERLEKENFFGVDINFGCSVAAICNKNCGAALLKEPARAADIVRAIRDAVSFPVFAKFRTGWSSDPAPAVELAKRFEDAGADALVFHPRVAPDRRGRPPRWHHIKLVKDAVSIPVFGNGNVFDADDAKKMIAETGCDGVSIGRAAIAKPWIFAELANGFKPGNDIYKVHILKMIELLELNYPPVNALKLFKKSAIYFAANFKFGHKIWAQMIKGDSMDDIKTNVNTIFKTPPEVSLRPNMNMFI